MRFEDRNTVPPVLADFAAAIRFDDEWELFDLLTSGHDSLRWINPAARGGEEQWQALVAQIATEGWHVDRLINESPIGSVERLIVVLPVDQAPAATRAMLFAAVTRARKVLVIVASRTALRRALST